jgi:hypothetical protein
MNGGSHGNVQQKLKYSIDWMISCVLFCFIYFYKKVLMNIVQ